MRKKSTRPSAPAEFEAAPLRSVDQALRGDHAVVHAPAQILARRRAVVTPASPQPKGKP